MKNYSYYQYIKTRAGEKSEIGVLSECIKNDSMFPKQETDYHQLSDYLERNPYPDIKLNVFDDSYQDYENWLNH
ncbi:MAG TPA: hypothetical protein H9994_05945 [Candidatus Salinicoccus merdavium]|nr:hypothetical protein [Candidatus Salinicoccus merdavium]